MDSILSLGFSIGTPTLFTQPTRPTLCCRGDGNRTTNNNNNNINNNHRPAGRMTDILAPDVNLNTVCERLEKHCCVEQSRQRPDGSPQPLSPLPPPPPPPPQQQQQQQTPVLSKRLPNTGAKLWGRVRSKLLRQKVPS